jgi:hypothetical protein
VASASGDFCLADVWGRVLRLITVLMVVKVWVAAIIHGRFQQEHFDGASTMVGFRVPGSTYSVNSQSTCQLIALVYVSNIGRMHSKDYITREESVFVPVVVVRQSAFDLKGTTYK